MAPRKVLLLTYHFPPSGAVAVYRMLGLVRYLPKFGWQPIVVAPPRVPWEPEDTSLLAHVPPELPIERVPFATGLFGKVARYLAPEGHWIWKARGACERMIRAHQPAALITSSPPGCVHVLGLRLQRRHRLPWLADFRDPWIAGRPLPRVGIRKCVEGWLEKRTMQRATVLIANTPLNQASWVDAYPEAAGKMVSITNGFDPERFVAGDSNPIETSPLTVLHAGELYYGRDPRPLLDALLGEPLPVQVEFLGRATEQICDLPAEIRTRGLEHCVHVSGQIAYKEAIQKMMHAGILLLVNTPGHRTGVPAKLYEYLGAGRPILALAEPDGDIAWVLRESGVLYRIASPSDVPRLRQALVELIDAVRAGQNPGSDRAALQQFTRERMAQKFADCLDRSVVTP